MIRAYPKPIVFFRTSSGGDLTVKNRETGLRHILDAADELADTGNLLAMHSAVKAAQLGELAGPDLRIEGDDPIWEKIIKVARETSRTVRRVSVNHDTSDDKNLEAISKRLDALKEDVEKLCAPPSRHRNGRHPAYSPASIMRRCTRIIRNTDELHNLLNDQCSG